jgi:hypothetical protein
MDRKLFIHIPKNGGMTLRRNVELRKRLILAHPTHHCNRTYTKRLEEKMRATGDDMGHEHARWRDVDNTIRNTYKSFAIVRNPWARVVSRYWFAKKVIEVEYNSNVYGNKEYADVSSFEAFLEERHKWGGEEFMWHRAVRGWYPAYDHVCDKEGNVRCDILRFENYNDDIKDYFKVLFDPEPRNVTGLLTDPYQSMYNDKTIQVVADWYKKDIDYWGFDFDTGATKNYWR